MSELSRILIVFIGVFVISIFHSLLHDDTIKTITKEIDQLEVKVDSLILEIKSLNK